MDLDLHDLDLILIQFALLGKPAALSTREKSVGEINISTPTVLGKLPPWVFAHSIPSNLHQ